MATVKATIQKRTGSGWDEIRPKTELAQIVDIDDISIDNLNDITDVNAPSPSDGEALIWDNSTSKWVPGAVSTGNDFPDGYTIDTDYFHTWTKRYTINNTVVQELLYKDDGSLPTGGVYRFTAHISATGTDNMAQAVFWNAGGTWKVNVTGQSGVSSNHPEFTVESNLPRIKIDHGSNYTIDVLGERMELKEGTGTDNAQFAFGAGSYLSSVSGVLRYNSGGGSNYTAGNTVYHTGNLPSFVSTAGDTMGNLRIESASFASLILDREGSTTTSNVVQFENNNGIVGGIGGYGNDGLQFRTTDGTQMVIDADNNVGIGTESPGVKLDVNGVIRGYGSLRVNEAAAGNPFLGLYQAGTEKAYFQYLDGGTGTDRLVIQSDGNFHFSGGNVGIGTTSPDAKLDVQGDAIVYGNLFVGGSDTNNFIAFRGTTGDGGTGQDTLRYNTTIIGEHIWGATEKAELILFKGNDASTTSGEDRIRTISAEFRVDTYSSNTGYPTNVDEAGAYGTTRMIVTKDGNVGIGTTGPSEKLEVVGDVLISDMLHLRANNAGEYAGIGFNRNVSNGDIYNANSPAFQLQLSSDNLELQRYNGAGAFQDYPLFVNGSTGNVGIGTNDPGSNRLNVNGVIKSNDEIIIEKQHSDTVGNGPLLYLSGLNNNSYSILQQGVGRLGFWQYSSAWVERMSLTGTGELGIGTTSPNTKLDVRGGIQRTNTRVDNNERYPLGHYTPGETVFEIDPTWTQDELRAYFNSNNVTWSADSSAPGGYSIRVDGAPSFGGQYGAGFPYIPIDQDDEFYMEMWIRSETGAVNSHYLGSNEYNQSFSSLGGNPGSFGYWVLSNTQITDTWTKVSGYIGNFSNSVGDFEVGAKYWTPLMLANYTNVSGSRVSYISGWKVIRVSHPGSRYFKGNVNIAENLFLGADNKTPKIDMLFDDHTSGVVWDTRIEIGKAQDFVSLTPSYIPNGNAYGINFKGNSDGVFFGMEQYNTTNFRPIINWGDDTSDSPFSIRFNNSNRMTLDSSGNAVFTGSVTAGGNKLAWVKTQGTTLQSGVNFTLTNGVLYISTTS